MLPFDQARERHGYLAQLPGRDAVEARALWNAIVGRSDPRDASAFADAARDTAPVEHGSLLASPSGVAAAFAFGCLWRERNGDFGRTPSAFEWREKARRGWETFLERAEQREALVEGFGWDLSDAWEQDREVLPADIDREQVERIARLAGRMYNALRGARAKRVASTPEEVHGVELGNVVGRLLPSELMHLDEPTEPLLLERIQSRKALQYAVRGTAPASRGPLVIALDESGSMHGKRQEYSKAAAVALARVAHDDGRAVRIVHFSTSVVERDLLPGDKAGLVKMISHFLSGGTDIGRALRASAEQVLAMAARGDKGADVVVITDGCDPGLTAADVDAITKIGSRLWTIAIECEVPHGNALRDRAEHYSQLTNDDLTADSVVPLVGAVAR